MNADQKKAREISLRLIGESGSSREAIIASALRAEREECAKVAIEKDSNHGEYIAYAIRARGER